MFVAPLLSHIKQRELPQLTLSQTSLYPLTFPTPATGESLFLSSQIPYENLDGYPLLPRLIYLYILIDMKLSDTPAGLLKTSPLKSSFTPF